MNIYKAIQTKKSMDDDVWWDAFLSALTLILSSAPKLKEAPHFHAEIETATGNIRALIHRRLQSTEVTKQTNYLIQHETDITIESIQHIQQLALHRHPAYKGQLAILTNHADRLVDALMSYDFGGTTRQFDEMIAMDIKRSDELEQSSFHQFDTMGQKLKKTISLLKPIQHHNHSKDRRQMNIEHGDQSNAIKNAKAGFMNLFTTRKSSRSSLRELFNSHKKRDGENYMVTETLLPDKLYDSFYPKHSSHNRSNSNSNNSNNTIQPNRREIKERRSDSTLSSLISPPSIDSTPMVKRRNSLVLSTDLPNPPLIPTEHYYDDPYFFNDFPSLSPTEQEPTPTKTNSSKASTISSSDSSYFSAKSSSLHSFADPIGTADNIPGTPIPIPQPTIVTPPPPVDCNTEEPYTTKATSKWKNTIRQLSGPPPLHQPGQSKKSREKDGSPLYHVFDKNGRQIMVLEISAGKPKMVAATREQLMLKLADESPQDFDYVDAYLLNHTSFTSSSELLDDLITRFHLEPSPGHQDYFHQWQRRIQIKTLNVLSRWIKLQFSDFTQDRSLLLRLENFCSKDLISSGFAAEAAMIKDSIYAQASGHYTRYQHSHCNFSPYTPSTASQNYSGATSPPITNTTPPDSPLLSAHYQLHQHSPPHQNISHHIYLQRNNTNTNPFLSFNAKDIAKYLTLADYHLIKQIKSRDYLDGHWRDTQYNRLSLTEIGSNGDFIGILTKRANMINHWIIHELATAKTSKQRKTILRKLIETSKLCLEWNNFHTSMVLTMGLLSHPVQKMEETWQSLSNRDKSTFGALKKLVDVSHNMGHYRHALQEGLHPDLSSKRREPFSHVTPAIKDLASGKASPLSSFKDQHHYNGSHIRSLTSNINNSTSFPTLLFFPVVLKDLAFLMDGNSDTYGQQQQQETQPQKPQEQQEQQETQKQGYLDQKQQNEHQDHEQHIGQQDKEHHNGQQDQEHHNGQQNQEHHNGQQDQEQQDEQQNENAKSPDNSGDDGDNDNVGDDTLVNFAKFSSLAQYVTKVVQSTMGNYWFAMELTHFPFLPVSPRSSTDSLYSIYYSTATGNNLTANSGAIPYSPTRSSISTVSSSVTAHAEHHITSSGHYYSPSSSSLSSVSSGVTKQQYQHQPYHHHLHHYHQYNPGAGAIKSQNLQSLSLASVPSSSVTSSLDWVAETIEQRLTGVSGCYGDPHCESRLDQTLKTTL